MSEPLSSLPVTRELGRWVAGVHADRVDKALHHHVSRLLIDHAASTIAGSGTDAARTVAEYLESQTAGGAATVLGRGTLPAPAAAFANGYAAHILELDDGYTPGASHPSCATLPAVLAAAEAWGTDTKGIVPAALVAVEVACRVAEAGHPATWRVGFHNTGLAGVVGAAAGVARLAGLGPDETTSALGLAVSGAAGVFQFLEEPADVKPLHPGHAARHGLEAAELAARGVRGPASALEGRYGYYAAYAGGDWDPDALLADLGTTWRSMATYVKPWPCCRHLHGAIEAMQTLRHHHGVGPDDVCTATVETYAVAARHNGTQIGSRNQAQMSLPWAVAVAAHHDRVELESFENSARACEELAGWMSHVHVETADDLDRLYPAARPTRLRVTDARGDQHTAEVRVPWGEPSRPVSDDELNAKFLALTTRVLPREQADWVLQELQGLTRPESVASALARLRIPKLPGGHSG